MRDQRHIQSIEVGFRLIRVLQLAGSKMTLKSVAEAAEMPPAKAHLYMVSFIRQGLVVQDPITLRYSLGPYAVQLGLAAIRQIDVVDIAREPMQALQDKLRLPVFLSLWGNLGPAIVFKLDWNTLLPVTMKIGYIPPLLSSATGQIFLAYLPIAETAEALQRDIKGKDAKNRIAEIKASVTGTNLATSENQVNEGFAAISSGIFDHEDRLAAAVTALGFAHQIDIGPNGEPATLLKMTTLTISQALGSKRTA